MASKKEVKILEEMQAKIKAVYETQAVLRDGIVEMRKYLKCILERMDEIEATSEVLKLSIRRKIDVEELDIVEKRLMDIERRIPLVNF